MTKLYTAVRRLIDSGGSTEEALEIQQKLHDRYTAYLECHETALVEVPERETSLNTSHVDVDQRHQEHVEHLQAYIDDGIKTEGSMHVRSLFSLQSRQMLIRACTFEASSHLNLQMPKQQKLHLRNILHAAAVAVTRPRVID